MFPELAEKSESRSFLIEVNGELNAQCPPKVQQGNVGSDRPQIDVRVEIKNGLIGGESIEGIGVKVIAMRRVGRPVGVGVMRRDEADRPAMSGDPIKLADKRHNIRNMLDHVTRYDQVKLVVRERVGNDAEVVDNVRGGSRIVVQADRTFKFIGPAADVEDLHRFNFMHKPARWQGRKCQKSYGMRKPAQSKGDTDALNISPLLRAGFGSGDPLRQIKMPQQPGGDRPVRLPSLGDH